MDGLFAPYGRGGLVLGLGLGMIGGGLAGTAVVTAPFGLFLAGLALMGTAQAALQLARFAAAEVHVAAQRGRAIATVVMGGTLAYGAENISTIRSRESCTSLHN